MFCFGLFVCACCGMCVRSGLECFERSAMRADWITEVSVLQHTPLLPVSAERYCGKHLDKTCESHESAVRVLLFNS